MQENKQDLLVSLEEFIGHKIEIVRLGQNSLNKSRIIKGWVEEVYDLQQHLVMKSLKQDGKTVGEYLRFCDSEYDKWFEVVEKVKFILQKLLEEEMGIQESGSYKNLYERLKDLGKKSVNYVNGIIEEQINVRTKIELEEKKKAEAKEYENRGLVGKTFFNVGYFINVLINDSNPARIEEEIRNKWEQYYFDSKYSFASYDLNPFNSNKSHDSWGRQYQTESSYQRYCIISSPLSKEKIKQLEKERDIQIYKNQLKVEFEQKLMGEKKKYETQINQRFREVVIPKIIKKVEIELDQTKKGCDHLVEVIKKLEIGLDDALITELEKTINGNDIDIYRMVKNIVNYNQEKQQINLTNTLIKADTEIPNIFELCKSKLPLLVKHFGKKEYVLFDFWYNNNWTTPSNYDSFNKLLELMKRGNILIVCEAFNNITVGIYIRKQVKKIPLYTKFFGVDFSYKVTFQDLPEQSATIGLIQTKKSKRFLHFGKFLTIKENGFLNSPFIKPLSKDHYKNYLARTISIYQFR